MTESFQLEPDEVREPVEVLAKRLKTEPHWFSGAKAGERWPVGAELFESEYLAAIERAKGVSVR